MRRLSIAALIFFAAFSFAHAQAPQPARAATTETSGPAFRQHVEKDTFLLVNQYRKEHDLAPFVWDDEIAKTARQHSKDMATGDCDFGHDGFGDRVSQLKKKLPGLWGAGENVLYTGELDDVAKRAVQLWLKSPAHLKNIRGDYTNSGLGVWQNKDGTLYFTQFFVKIKALEKESRTAPPDNDSSLTGLLANPIPKR